jgi:hypothetical protein
LLLEAGDADPAGLTPAGVAILGVSVTCILTLVVACYVRLLRTRSGKEADDGPR